MGTDIPFDASDYERPRREAPRDDRQQALLKEIKAAAARLVAAIEALEQQMGGRP